MKMPTFYPKFDSLGVKTVLELVLAGIVGLCLMRWLGMW